MGGQELPHRRVVRINHQVLSRCEQAVAGFVNVLSRLDDRFLCLASLGTDLGRGGGKLGAGSKCCEGLNSLDERSGGLVTSLTVLFAQTTSKRLGEGEGRRERGEEGERGGGEGRRGRGRAGIEGRGRGEVRGEEGRGREREDKE